MRRSLALLETFVLQNGASPSLARTTADADYFALQPSGSSLPPPDDRPPKRESVEPVDLSAPGSFGRQSGGLYAGPTSTSTHLLSNDAREPDETSDHPPSEPEALGEYDRDLLDLLPGLADIDSLIGYYFQYCNWLWRYVNHAAFMKAWTRYKTGGSTDRLALATACCVIAIATFYLPEDHALRNALAPPENDDEQQGDLFYNVAMQVLARHQKENTKYSLELVEFHLARCHHLTLSKKDTEGVWAAKGELITMATAMGLHRDPGKWKMSRDTAERRRWAWWHIIHVER